MLLLTLSACWIGWGVNLGTALTAGDTATVETDVESACSWVVDYSPAPRETVRAEGLEIRIELDGDWGGSAGIFGAETETELLGQTLVLRPTQDLLPNTTYTWWLETGCQSLEATFTTTRFGGELELSVEELSASAYDLLMTPQATLTVPAEDAELEQLLRGWVWGRGSVDASGQLTLSQVEGGAQDYCATTQTLQGYFAYPAPEISWVGEHVLLTTDAGLLDFEELRLDGTFAPDGGELGYLALSGLIGASQLSAYFGTDYCESMAGTQTLCVGCQDPQGCVRVRVEDAAGLQRALPVEEIEEARCHALCSDNAEDCELDG